MLWENFWPRICVRLQAFPPKSNVGRVVWPRGEADVTVGCRPEAERSVLQRIKEHT